MLRLASLSLLAIAAAGCGSSPSAPPIDTTNLPPTERTEDWEDWGKDENVQRRVSGTPLAGESISSLLVGQVLSGCYINGESFSERLTDQGTVVMTNDNAAVAQYQVQGNNLCFAYPEQPVACYTVTQYRDGYLFYTAGGYRLVASTVCPIPGDVRGQPEG